MLEIVLLTISAITVVSIEKIKKQYDLVTYKEIFNFYESKSLSHDDKISKKTKRPYQKVLLSILFAIIAIVVFSVMNYIFV